MKNLIVLLFLAVLFLVTSCGEAPVADFTWEPENPVAGEEMQFINQSTNARSYSWNFGDMSIGSDESPKHVYEMPGEYIIDLFAFNGFMSDEMTLTITIIE